MGNGASNSGWSRNFMDLKRYHDDAYRTIQDAITLEEQERSNDAVEKYKEGIQKLDKALDIVITCPENPDAKWEQACSMVQKMKKTRAEVLTRINCITSAPEYIHRDPPPTYEDAMSSCSDSSLPRTYNELAEALNNLDVTTPQGLEEIIYSHEGVLMYFIGPDNTVISSSDTETLQIALISGEEGTTSTAFLKIGNWVYPLVPGVSPCFRTEYKAFIFPDVHSNVEGASVGIILPEEADELVLELLENILHGIIKETKPDEKVSRIRRYVREEDPGVSGYISQGIINGASFISRGLIFGAEKATDLLNYGTPKVINSLTPTPRQTPIPRKVAKGIHIAETTTSKAAQATGFVAEKVGVATSKLGQFLAPHIQKQGTRILTSGFNYSENEASDKVNGVLTVAAGAVEGFATVFKGLETSASILGNNLKENSVKIVKHKYGTSAGEVTGTTFNTVGNVLSIRNNTRFLTPKGLAKTTGKAVVQGYASASTSQGYNEPHRYKRDLSSDTTSSVESTENDSEKKSKLYPSLEEEEEEDDVNDFVDLKKDEKSLQKKE